MAKIAKGPQGFFDLFQNGFAKKEPKPDSMQEEFIELCRKAFGKEGIERFNEIMKEFYENAGVVPLTQYNELHDKYVDLKDKMRELEKKIEKLKKRLGNNTETPSDLMNQLTEAAKEYADINQQFFEEFSKFFKQ
ncbi:MAG: hypothetical protein QF466_00330 [Desulfobacterales bacterium]|nr:hypothetical protein [Desulfobacterales bacterium]MDP6684246.1 hypothetical protein [Desulfobacterales bacterium]MDP6808104.1 hypothetical protein [Desulfobacterales bacterium]